MTEQLEVIGRSELERDPDEQCDATFWRQATPGSSYVRCELPARYLPGQMLRLRPTDLSEAGDDVVIHRARGAQVFQFAGDATRGTIMAELQSQGFPVFLEVDDNYLLPVPHWFGMKAGWSKTIEDARHGTGYSHEAHRRLVSWVDGVIVSTEALAKQYSKLNPNVHVCPNAVDPGDWPTVGPPDDGVIRIVYAGSPSHQADASLVRRAMEWASRQPNVEVYSFGFRPASWNFPMGVIEWTDSLQEYRQALGLFDIGVAPLVENPWSVGKSDLKVLEYAMAGVLPVVSRAEPYRPWFDTAVPTCSTPKAFYHAIKYLVSDIEAVKESAALVRQQVLRDRTIQNTVYRWRDAIAGGT